MKKILIVSNVFLLTVIFFIAFNAVGRNGATKKESGAIMKNEVTGNALPDTSEELAGLIDDNLAVMMSRAYRNDLNKSRVNGATKKSDATSIWFSLKRIKLFIEKVEASVASKKGCDPLALGIRMYYAKYPKRVVMADYRSLDGLSRSVANMHTIFMTPTYRYRGQDIDFNFEDVGDSCRPTPFSQLLIKPGPHKISIFMGTHKPLTGNPVLDGFIPVVENHGGLMPPPAGTGAFPTGGEE